MAPNSSTSLEQSYSKYLLGPYRLLETVRPSTTAGTIHDGTATSFLDAMVNLGDDPSMDSINAILSSFAELKHEEQDKVLQDPKVSSQDAVRARGVERREQTLKSNQYWNSLAKWGTEEDREEMSRRNVERLKKDLEDVVYGVGTRKSTARKDEAARLLATIPEKGKLFEWTRAMVCKEDSGNDSIAGEAGLK